jgi:hypothetical protein
MSEYQYYEFLALDQALDGRQLAELRAISSRADISPTRFANAYNWGDLRADPGKLVEKYFDAFLYLANWGTHRLMLRLPRRLLDPATAGAYCSGDAATVTATSDHIILDLTSEDEGGDWEGDGEGWLAAIVPVRADLAAGDLRALYLGWLLCAQTGEMDDDEPEPPVPPGLGDLTGALSALAEFLRIDPDLIAAAAAASPRPQPLDEAGLTAWIAALPAPEKDALLLRAAHGASGHLGAELVQRFRAEASPHPQRDGKPLTVGALREAAEVRAAERRRREAAERAEEAARAQREAELALERRLAVLAGREEDAWREADTRMATKQSAEYDAAVRLLKDLQTLHARDGRLVLFAERMARLRQAHARKYSLMDRLKHAGL